MLPVAHSPKYSHERPNRVPGRVAEGARQQSEGIDGISRWLGMRWDHANTVRLEIRPDLINAAGLLSGAVTYALVDYCMGSTLWKETAEDERIATVRSPSTTWPRRPRARSSAARRWTGATAGSRCCAARSRPTTAGCSCTAIGSYTIFPQEGLAMPTIDATARPSTTRSTARASRCCA